MNAELKSKAVTEVARVLKSALGFSNEEDDSGIFTMCVEIDDGGGHVSEARRDEMGARYPQRQSISIND